MPTVAKFDAMPAPVPPEEPLACRLGSYAFLMGPDAELRYPDANSPMVAFPTITAPACFSFVTIVASVWGTKALNTADPYVVVMSLVST